MNDLIHAGSKLQNKLFDVLIQFRRNAVAVFFVISEIYWQLKLRLNNCKYLNCYGGTWNN